MFYAIRYAYGSTVANNGTRADEVYEFSARRLRDAWVADGPPDISASGYRAAASARDALVRKADYKYDGDTEAWAAIAARRVDTTPSLAPYRDLLIDEDWGDTSHYRWTATAPEREVLSWARDTRAAQVDA